MEEPPFTVAHTRLAVQDVTTASAQPFRVDGVTLTYNGELWHPWQTAMEHRVARATTGDTEIVAKVLAAEGIDALPTLRGMFAVAWVQGGALYLARDAWGEVPLHYGWTRRREFVYASEVGPLLALGARPDTVSWVEPGTALIVRPGLAVESVRWAPRVDLRPLRDHTAEAGRIILGLLNEGVTDRMRSDVPVAVLLSGGLDSSLCCALLAAGGYQVHPYVAFYDVHSPDLRYARMVADHLGLTLNVVPVPPPTRGDLAHMVSTIEMPHKAQVEIAWACDALGARLSADGFKVVLSGEGSDELWASYGMDYHGVQRYGWHRWRYMQFTNQHRKNFARTNKVFMHHGVEARLPFLHTPLVHYALRLSEHCVTEWGKHPKAVLASAATGMLPAGMALRSKMAFQTAAGIDRAAAEAIAVPDQFYKAEFTTNFREVKP